MFAEATEWKMPWLKRVLPSIVAITSAHGERTIFTRFIPARKPGQGVGMWRYYYERWLAMTIDRIGPDMIGLVPDLMKFVPPAKVFDKHVYSPWTGSDCISEPLRRAGRDGHDRHSPRKLLTLSARSPKSSAFQERLAGIPCELIELFPLGRYLQLSGMYLRTDDAKSYQSAALYRRR
jgi:hypothetical protein